jgi:NAD-dependent deacetylase
MQGEEQASDRGLDEVAGRLRAARRIVVLTGAGVSAASGVPTFRGREGLWRTFRPEDLATPRAFERDPTVVWEWYDWRRQRIAACSPNRAHEVLASWSLRHHDCHIVTQNVDDLHLRARTRDLVRLHGSVWEMACWNGCGRAPSSWRDETVPLAVVPPRCPACGGLARPAVVWFGEALAPVVMRRAAALTACDVFLTVGTSAVVHPAASLVYEARRHGAFTAEVNLESTPASEVVDVALQGRAEDVLERLERRLT